MIYTIKTQNTANVWYISKLRYTIDETVRVMVSRIIWSSMSCGMMDKRMSTDCVLTVELVRQLTHGNTDDSKPIFIN